MNWQAIAGLSAMVNRSDGRSLMVFVSRGGNVGPWQVAAFETPTPDLDAPAVDALRAAFNEHAHAQLDPVPTLAEALALGEKYAKWWRSSRATHFDCNCEEIDPPKESPSP